MKVTFVRQDIVLPFPRPWAGCFYCGIECLSVCLKQAGCRIPLILYLSSREEILAQLANDPPNLVPSSSTSYAFPSVSTLAGWVRDFRRNLPMICGGVHPMLSPEEVIAAPGRNYPCVGEGDEALPKLCTKLEEARDPARVANIWAERDGEEFRNAPHHMSQNLDSIPFPELEILDCPWLYNRQEWEEELLTSRGCPYQCTYCCNLVLREASCTGGAHMRIRSADNVIAEFQDLIRRYSFIHFPQFEDDLPFVKLDRTREFSGKYRRLVNLPFRFNARHNLVSRKQMELLKEANCREVKVGVESGNEDIMNRVLNRNLSVKYIKDAFAIFRDLGIRTTSFNMVGLPGETSRTILDTIKLNAQVQSDICQVSIFHPYKGTPLYDIYRDKGFLTEKKIPDYFSDTVLQMTSVLPYQILFYRRCFRFMVFLYRALYKLPQGVGKHLIRLVDAILASKRNVRFLSFILDPLARIKRRIVFAL
jgi:anaerobic magnesium-protoporphyrin IX monomethyl ester cyclase